MTVVDGTEIPVDNIKILRQAKALGLCVNYRKPDDLKMVEDALRAADITGADYVQVRPALYVNGLRLLLYPPELPKDPRIELAGPKFSDCDLAHGYDRCYGHHFVPFIWENGDLDACGYMREYPGYNMGNIYRESFDEIMRRSPEYFPVHTACQVCCKNHEINKLVNEVKAIKDENFV